MASPAMKLASTMLEAHTPLPSATAATRNQRVSNRSPAAPEKKNITQTSDANGSSSSAMHSIAGSRGGGAQPGNDLK